MQPNGWRVAKRVRKLPRCLDAGSGVLVCGWRVEEGRAGNRRKQKVTYLTFDDARDRPRMGIRRAQSRE